MASRADVTQGDFDTIRLSKIAGRYLVFDPEAVVRLRRLRNTNGTLTGTTPQQPTQNVFLGLPLEIGPEEAFALLHQKAAFVVDDAAAHEAALFSPIVDLRELYSNLLRSKKRTALSVLSNRSALMASGIGNDRKQGTDKTINQDLAGSAHVHTTNSELFIRQHVDQRSIDVRTLAVTPVCSTALLPKDASLAAPGYDCTFGALCRSLRHRGNYLTPGLRFGAQYSVYPGDPLRFHAHFMANEYEWNEQIPILEIVGGGRLATAVKKAYLIGGLPDQEGVMDGETVRTFSIEWAAM